MKDLHELPTILGAKLRPIWHYRLLGFIIFVTILCGYLVFQINKAVSIPASTEVTTSPTTTSPRIDTKVVEQLQQLQDNSVSVKALFNDARDNPFQ